MGNFLIVGGKRGLSKALADRIIKHDHEVILVEREQWDVQRPITLLPFLRNFSENILLSALTLGS